MPAPDSITSWQETMQSVFPHLSRPQACVLAQASYGVMGVRSCGMTTVAAFLGMVLDQPTNTVRQRLREFTYGVAAKRGAHRREIAVAQCFVPLVHWILSLWDSDERRVVLALDATTLGTRFTVLSISLVLRGTALPIAWVILPACTKGTWRPHWLALLEQLRGAFPPHWQVLVTADRGLYAKWLYLAIQANGWHPFLRINQQGTARAPEHTNFHPLGHFVPTRGCAWRGPVELFRTKAARLSCTLLAYWDEQHTDPWLVVTDLDAETVDVVWYGLRGWIEQLFKDLKRGGWQWQDTQMTDPERAARWWLVLAVATVQVVALGVEHEVQEAAAVVVPGPDPAPTRTLPRPPAPVAHSPQQAAPRRRGTVAGPRQATPRTLSCFERGRCRWAALIHRGEPIPAGRLVPEPWPALPLWQQAAGGTMWEQRLLWPEQWAA